MVSIDTYVILLAHMHMAAIPTMKVCSMFLNGSLKVCSYNVPDSTPAIRIPMVYPYGKYVILLTHMHVAAIYIV